MYKKLSRHLVFIHLIFAISIALSCNRGTNPNRTTDIYIDFSDIETVDLSQAQKVHLEFTDHSIIRSVDNMVLTEDSNYLILSGQDLFVFDKNGTFKNRIGSKGQGPMEFKHLASFFLKNMEVVIYDHMARKLISYDTRGNFLHSTSIKNRYNVETTPNYIYPISNKRFLASNFYGSDEEQRPSYSILDEDYRVIATSEGRYLKSGLTVMNKFFANEEFTLIWEVLNDTILAVDNNNTFYAKYRVDFNKKAIPESVKKWDIYDAIAFCNKPENAQKYATLIRSVSEDKEYVRFIFAYNHNTFYTKYDKTKARAKTYKLVDDSGTIGPIIYLHNKHLIVPINNSDDSHNPTLAIVDETDL